MAITPFEKVGPWTEADLLALPDTIQRLELLEGTLLVNPPPSTPHQLLSVNLVVALRAACPAHCVVVEAVGVRAPDNTVLIPDVLVVQREPALRNRSGIHDPADVVLVVEIVSPSSRTADRLTKPAIYAQAGIPSYWRVEPDAGPSVTAYRLEGDHYAEAGSVGPGEVLAAGEPFPLRIDPADLRP